VHTNLRPGDSLRAYLDQPAIRDTVKQIGGNVLLGAPFGVLLPMLGAEGAGAVRVVLVTSLVWCWSRRHRARSSRAGPSTSMTSS
jgi:uncharacterized protein (DUF2062 family)